MASTLSRSITRATKVIGLIKIALAICLLSALVLGCGGEPESFRVEDAQSSESADYEYLIPEGAGIALDAGSPLEILPARLDAKVGETVEIVNADDRGHLVGPWFVGAGETLRQTFASPGEFIGECTVHPSGTIRVVISA